MTHARVAFAPVLARVAVATGVACFSIHQALIRPDPPLHWDAAAHALCRGSAGAAGAASNSGS